jgi:hypothetical protein
MGEVVYRYLLFTYTVSRSLGGFAVTYYILGTVYVIITIIPYNAYNAILFTFMPM